MEHISELHRKTNEVLSKFKNGKELYYKSAMFNQIVQCLVRGEDAYVLLEQTCLMHDSCVDALRHHIMVDAMQPKVMPFQPK